MENNIDLKSIGKVLIKHIYMIISLVIIGIVVACMATIFFIKPKYSSDALMYVQSDQEISQDIDINEINTAQKLVNTCIIIFKSETVLAKVKDNLQLDISISELNEMISLASVNGTEVLKIKVIADDPQLANDIVNQLIVVGPQEYLRVVNAGDIDIINEGVYNPNPISPNLKINIVIGFFCGLVIAIIVILIITFMDTTIKEDDDLEKIYNIPVLSEIMDFKINYKGKSYEYKQE